MQAVINAVTSIDWSNHIPNAWNWAQVQSASGYAFVLGLPSSCKLATVHAGLVCAGQIPQYVPVPGFAPLSFAWGWLLVGIIFGSMVTALMLSLGGCLRREPTIGALAAVAHPQMPAAQPPPPGLAPAPRMRRLPQPAAARQDIFEFLAVGGGDALAELAAASGMTELDFLRTLVANGQRRNQFQ